MKTKKGKDIKIKVDEYTLYAPGVFKLTIEDELEQIGNLLIKENIKHGWTLSLGWN